MQRPAVANNRRRGSGARVWSIGALVAAGLASATCAMADTVDMAAAKAEGTLTWYTSTPQKQAEKIGHMFEQKTGIQVRVYRSGGEATMRRFLVEQSAGTVQADVITTSDPAAFNDLARAGKLMKFTPSEASTVLASAKSADGTWIAQRLNMIVPAYRTDRVKNPPKSFADLADARFKDQMVMADPAFTSFSYLVVQTLSHSLGWEYFSRVAANGVMLVKGHAQVSGALESGERSVALEADAGQLYRAIKKGAPIKLVAPTDGVFLIDSPMAIPVGAPHPAAAKAFLAFNLSVDVQKLFTSGGTYSVRSDMAPPAGDPELGKLKLVHIDYGAAARENKKVKDRFAEIFH